MTDKLEITIFVAMNENGEWTVASDDSEAVDQLSEHGCSQCRTIKLTVKMAPPTLEEIEVTVPDTAGATSELKVS